MSEARMGCDSSNSPNINHTIDDRNGAYHMYFQPGMLGRREDGPAHEEQSAQDSFTDPNDIERSDRDTPEMIERNFDSEFYHEA
ncbi:hypothetical protein FQN53_002004 [Emmonsiellopsis sp. PD_33]|nr:hypothetical protein FQN53_002004 [Emmonsiellopsis sp. PD_33]